MKKLFVLVMVCAMIFSFAACGAKEAAPAAPAAESAPASASEATPVPEGAVISEEEDKSEYLSPSTLNIGDSGNPDHAGDTWYKDGNNPDDCIYFEKADNSASGLACVSVQGGNIAKTWLCKETDDKHLVDQDAAEGQSEIDIVFPDVFTAINKVNGNKYIRGTKEGISQLFVGKKLIEQENTANSLVFNADGTGKEVFDGKEYDLKWELDSASTLKFADGNNEFNLTIKVDDNGNLVSLYDRNLRTYVPEA